MPLIILLVFCAVFALIALLMIGFGKPATSKQTEAALAAALGPARSANQQKVVDVRKEHRLSAIPWLHDLLSRIDISITVRRMLSQADMTWTLGKLMLISVAVGITSGYLVALRLGSPLAGILVGLVAGTVPLSLVLWKRRSRLLKIQEKLPETLDLMVSALRAGHSMVGALGAAAKEAPEPIGREFRLCYEEQNFGLNLRAAMDNLMERIPVPDLRIVATAMLIHKETGGNLAEVLDKTSLIIRERFLLQQKIRVHTAQGRLTGLVLMSLPTILAILIYVTNPEYLKLLFSRSLGHKFMAAAAVMNVIGLLIIRKIVNIRV
ncbi:MAG: Flp pilus assembly protein TadB [Bryobacterales bacterium]|nr:Flp pilus assembly protein TadB [Bryobacterales bacterium]